MVVVSKDIFDKLNSGAVSEDNADKSNSSLKPLNFSDFTSSVEKYSQIVDYLKTVNIEFVGAGSSRVAFLVPKGSCDDAKDRAICFKVAMKNAGIAQNKAERAIFTKYGKAEKCFPEIFAYDEKRNLCLETEIGADLAKFNLSKYFNDWNNTIVKKAVKTGFVDKMKGFCSKRHKNYNMFRKNLGSMLSIDSIQSLWDVLILLKDFNRSDSDLNKMVLELYLKAIQETAEEHKKYLGVSSLANVLFKKGADAEMVIGDFRQPKNYAMVDRGEKDPTLIPIDYGLTEKVYDSFYTGTQL